MTGFPAKEYILHVAEYTIYASFGATVIAAILAAAVFIIARGRW